MERYTAMYPCGQPGLPDDPVTAYVNGLSTTGCPWVYDDSVATDRATSRPHVGVQRLRGHRIEQLRIGAGSAPSGRQRPAARVARRARGGKAPA
jgi:hypothetical protein